MRRATRPFDLTKSVSDLEARVAELERELHKVKQRFEADAGSRPVREE